PRGHEISFHQYLCIFELAPGAFYVGRQGFVGGDGAPTNSINGSKDQHPVTERCNWFLAFNEVTNDLLQLGIVTEIFWSPAAAEDDAIVISGIDVRETNIGRNVISGFLYVGIPAGFEIVHHRFQDFLHRRADVY